MTQAWTGPRERVDKEEIIWIKRLPQGFFQTRVFVDGPAADPEQEILRRAGWAIVQCSEAGQVRGAARGTVPLAWAPMQLARGGEDYAFHFLAGCSQAPLEVFGDCAGSIRQAVDKGKALAKGAARRHMWKKWWQELGGHEQVHVTKAKADRSKSECVTETEHWTREGNEVADHYAKQGAKAWKVRPERRQAAAGAHHLTKMTARRIGQPTVWLQQQEPDAEGHPERGDDRPRIHARAPPEGLRRGKG